MQVGSPLESRVLSGQYLTEKQAEGAEEKEECEARVRATRDARVSEIG